MAGRAKLARMRTLCKVLVIFATLALAVLPLDARVTRVEISSRADVLNGKAFRGGDLSRVLLLRTNACAQIGETGGSIQMAAAKACSISQK